MKELDNLEYKEKKLNRRNLKRMREIYGATQDEIADIIGVSRVSISNWENGVGGMISRVNLEKMRNLYGLDIEYFFDREIDNLAREIIIKHKNDSFNSDGNSIEKENIPNPILDTNHMPKKEDVFQNLFKKYTFQDAMENYLCAIKLVIALSVDCSAEELELARQIADQMYRRFNNALDERKLDIENGNRIEVLYSQLENSKETRLF